MTSNPPVRGRAFWRRAAAWGAQKGPEWFVRWAPIVIGCFFALVLGRTRRAVRSNLRLIRGPRSWRDELRDIVATFVHFARSLTAALAPARPFFRDREVEVVGRELVQPYFERRQGVILLTAHVGPWDVAAMKLSKMVERPVLMMMSGEDDAEAEAFQDAVREGTSVRVLRVGRTPLDALPAVEHIASGGILVAQVDRVPREAEAIGVSLFGAPFSFPRGLFRLASTLSCPIAPVFSARSSAQADLVRVFEPLEVPRRPTGAELGAAADQVARALEGHLRDHPTQWFHFPREQKTS